MFNDYYRNIPMPISSDTSSPERVRSRSRDEERMEKMSAWRDMGMLENGQSIMNWEEKRGVGAGAENEVDIYDSFRKKTSQQYKVAVGKRSRGNDTRGMICHICREYGHMARECPTVINPIN